MKTHLVEVGFVNIRMTASFTTYSTPEEVVFAHRPANRWFLSPEITGAAL